MNDKIRSTQLYQRGKFEMQFMAVVLYLDCLTLSIAEFFTPVSWLLSGFQWLFLLAIVVLLILANAGLKLRWWLSAILFVAALFTAYNIGTKFNQIGSAIYLYFFGDVAMLLSSLYLSWSSEIAVYLKVKQLLRKKNKEA